MTGCFQTTNLAARSMGTEVAVGHIAGEGGRPPIWSRLALRRTIIFCHIHSSRLPSLSQSAPDPQASAELRVCAVASYCQKPAGAVKGRASVPLVTVFPGAAKLPPSGPLPRLKHSFVRCCHQADGTALLNPDFPVSSCPPSVTHSSSLGPQLRSPISAVSASLAACRSPTGS